MENFTTPIKASKPRNIVVPGAPKKATLKRVPSVRRNLAMEIAVGHLYINTDLGNRDEELIAWGDRVEAIRNN